MPFSRFTIKRRRMSYSSRMQMCIRDRTMSRRRWTPRWRLCLHSAKTRGGLGRTAACLSLIHIFQFKAAVVSAQCNRFCHTKTSFPCKCSQARAGQLFGAFALCLREAQVTRCLLYTSACAQKSRHARRLWPRHSRRRPPWRRHSAWRAARPKKSRRAALHRPKAPRRRCCLLYTSLCKEALRACRLCVQKLSLLAVTAGPGSFTGLRIGLAVAKGLAFPHDIPCAGVSTLESLAFCAPPAGSCVCALDARRGEVYHEMCIRDRNSSTRGCRSPCSRRC